ncbi:barwin-like endoglucanase [Heliocybe sulcata]|uniref:Barwin-like endoglucanase n=1 Tax=Heliocybe sulcata TaxID=5364 RepID=A0A5C3MIX6_9AGAM|nr:barwin-like endoglucanase [Heliocybe sulcata]
MFLTNPLPLALLFSLTTLASAGSGDGTWFTPGLGACGATSASTDLIVALSPSEFASGAHCYKHITITFNGKTTDATVVDECPGCEVGSLDLSPAAFSALASLGAGRIKVDWWFA